MTTRRRVKIGTRIRADLHRDLAAYSERSGVPMNRIVEDAIRDRLADLLIVEQQMEELRQEAGT